MRSRYVPNIYMCVETLNSIKSVLYLVFRSLEHFGISSFKETRWRPQVDPGVKRLFQWVFCPPAGGDSPHQGG